MISKAALMEALGKRFDYQSTRSVYRDALSRSGLADQDGFSSADMERFVTALKTAERGLDAVLGALGIGPAVAAVALPGPTGDVDAPPADRNLAGSGGRGGITSDEPLGELVAEAGTRGGITSDEPFGELVALAGTKGGITEGDPDALLTSSGTKAGFVEGVA